MKKNLLIFSGFLMLLITSCRNNGDVIISVKAPTQAVNAGYSVLKFSDEFTSLSTIDTTNTGVPGKKWYTDRPWAWGVTPPGDLSITDGILTITPSTTSPNCNLITASQKGKVGEGFKYGYFEARMAFNPDDAVGSDGFPAFWSLSKNQVLNSNQQYSMEIDFFEAYRTPTEPFNDRFVGTIHEFNLTVDPAIDRATYGNNVKFLPGTLWTNFHTYGCLWQPGVVIWYFDDKEVLRQYYSATAEPNPNPNGYPVGTFSSLDTENEGLAILLGSGVNYPLKVDWVRVWQ